jgi:hypothetical protein
MEICGTLWNFAQLSNRTLLIEASPAARHFSGRTYPPPGKRAPSSHMSCEAASNGR